MTARRQNGISRACAMRPIAALLGVVLPVVAGGSGDDAPAATTTQAPATTQPAAESTTSLSSAEATVDATVVFEPGNCTYLGPAVIPRGTKATFEFDDGGHAVEFVVNRVKDGTTREEIIEYTESPNTDPGWMPHFAVEVRAYHQMGAGSTVVEFRDDGDWTVVCRTPPHLTNRLYLGGIVRVIEG
mgnify:CR=1 FL=1